MPLPAHRTAKLAMPTLKWFPTEGAPRAFSIFKPITTIGRALGNDVPVPAPGVAEMHAQVIFDGRDFNLEELDRAGEILINGKKKRRTRLSHGDRLTLGTAEIAFSIFEEPQAAAAAPVEGGPVGPPSASQDASLACLLGVENL